MTGNLEASRQAYRLRKWWISLPVAITILGSYPGWLFWTDNLHVVKENELYRSGQMNVSELAAAVKEHKIRSVLNLRGPNVGVPWYDDETQASARLGIEHADIALSAKRDVTDEEVSQLDSLLRSLPKPILVHCQAGGDRVGFVSAYYLHRFGGIPANEAAKQLSVLFGHFPYLFWSNSIAMDRSFAKYGSDLGFTTAPRRYAGEDIGLSSTP